MTPGVGGGLPKRAGLKGAGASSQSASPALAQTGKAVGRPEVVLDHVVPVAVGVEHRDRRDVQAPQRLEHPGAGCPCAGSTIQAEPPLASATT